MLNSLLLFTISAKLEAIMTTQAEHAAQLTALTTQVEKVGAETRALLTRIDELLVAVAYGQDAVSPEVQAALAALQEQVAVVDALVPDPDMPV